MEEKRKAGIRATMEHPFRVISRQTGRMKPCFRGWAGDQHGPCALPVRVGGFVDGVKAGVGDDKIVAFADRRLAGATAPTPILQFHQTPKQRRENNGPVDYLQVTCSDLHS